LTKFVVMLNFFVSWSSIASRLRKVELMRVIPDWVRVLVWWSLRNQPWIFVAAVSLRMRSSISPRIFCKTASF
jgi:hypothetical protein